MAGMFVLGPDIFNGIASGTIAVIACAVAGSVTVLPAVLELLGPRIDQGRIPFLPHLEHRQPRLPLLAGRRRPRAAPSRALLPRSPPDCSSRLRSRRCGMHVDKPSDEALGHRASRLSRRSAQVRTSFPSAADTGDRRRRGAPRQGAEGERCDSERSNGSRSRDGIAHPPFTVSGSADGLGAIDRAPAERARATTPRASARSSTLRNELVPADARPRPGRRDRCHRRRPPRTSTSRAR